MFRHAIAICLLLQSMEGKLRKAQEDGTLDRDEMVDLVVSFLAGLVDVLSDMVPSDVIESALDSVDAVRERIGQYRGKTAAVLDEANAAIDEIIE